jgi:hypothetical protein
MAKEKAKQLSAAERQNKVESILRYRDAGRRKYIAAGKLLDELIAGGMKPGDKVEISGGRSVTMVDNFAKTNKSFKNVTVDRFGLDVSYVD